MTVPILEGPIPPAGVVPLLQAVGIGRQTSAVRLFDGTVLLGQLWLRSGKVLAAEFGESEGVDALRKIAQQRAGMFTVSTETLAELPEPLGDLRTMLQQVGSEHGTISLLRGLERRARVGDTGVQSLPTLAVDSVPPKPPSIAPKPPSVVPPPPPAAPVRPRLTPATPISRAAGAPAVEAAQPAAKLPRSLTGNFERASVQRPAVASPVAPAPKAAEAPPAPERAIPTIAVASAKGGVGKTTISLNTAVALARRGLRVTLSDADPSGGVSAAINAHERRRTGTFDVLCGALRFADALVVSRMSSLRVLPSGGMNLSIEQIENAQGHRAGWQLLLREAGREADVVIVDTPAGTFGSTRILFSCVTHVLGVLQAEPIAMRVAEHFQRAHAASAPQPRVLGYVINMFDSRSGASASVLQDACRILPSGHVFETPIPRTQVINEASLRGVVPAQADLATAPAIAWAFEQLAAEVLARLELERPAQLLDEAPLF